MKIDRQRRVRHCIAIASAVAIAIAGWFLLRPSALPLPPTVQFVTLEGERVTLADLRGKVVLVNFWATTCRTCVQEMPDMAALYRAYRPHGLEAIFVAMPYDRPDFVLKFARERALPFKVALDVQGELVRAFGDVRFTPTTFVLDPRGRIVQRVVGEVDFARLRDLIATHLGLARSG